MTATACRFLAPGILAAGIAVAQVGYPPGGYPGQTPYPRRSPYPGGGTPIPVPSRGKGSTAKQDASQPLPRFRGMLKRMDGQDLTLEMGDHRVLDFKRTSKTRFFSEGAEARESKFKDGDEVTVEAQQDQGGYLTAVNIYWEAAAKSESEQKDRRDGVADTWADAPRADAPRASVDQTPPPAPRDADDPGPPRLRRGGPADATRERAAAAPDSTAPVTVREVQDPSSVDPNDSAAPRLRRRSADDPVVREGGVVTSDEPATPSLARRVPEKLVDDNPPAVIDRRPLDDHIRRAAAAALEFIEGLPAYVCQEVITRYQSESRVPSWQALDVVTAAVVYENGREEYRDITVNGKKSAKSFEETGGAWSTGEFGTVLIDLFAPATAAEFHFRGESRIGGVNTRVYDFDVARENSHWNVKMASQSYRPAYKGSVWIDPQTARVMRIEMQGYGFPQDFPTDTVESATEYQYIRLGDAKQYLLPVHAETLGCQRGTPYCFKNVIDFRNYHKYSGESHITFDTPK